MMKKLVNISLISGILAFSAPVLAGIPFKIKGQPINPGCLAIFNRFSEMIDYVTQINLEQCQLRQNQASGNKVSLTPDGWRQLQYSPKFGGGYYRYKLIGKTLNGIFVIDTLKNSGGSAEIEGILLLRVNINKEHEWSSEKRKFEPVWHTNLNVISRFEGGDRASGSYHSLHVEGNHIKGMKYSDQNDPAKPQYPDRRIDVDVSGL